MNQLPLFDTPPPSVPAGRRHNGRWLAETSILMTVLAASPTLRRCAADAARSTKRRHGEDRNAASPFETAFKALLLDAETAQAVSDETVAAAHAMEMNLARVELLERPDGSPADIVVRFRAVGKTPTAIAVNIKRLRPETTRTECASLGALIRLATETDYDVMAPPRGRFATDAALVDWVAGGRKIRPGRDYYALVVYTSGGRLHGVEAWGALSQVRGDGRPIVERHVSKSTFLIHRPAATLPDDYDVNAEVSRALLPRASTDSLRATMTAVMTSGVAHDDARQLAARVLAVADAELLAWAHGAVAA